MIIAARDEADVLPAQLDALLAQEWDGDWEVVVADNGSTDATRRIVHEYADADDRVRLVDASDRPGAGHARNVGMAAAAGDAFAFCDADDLVEPGWVAAMGDALSEHPVVGGRTVVDALNPPWLRTAYYQRTPDSLEYFQGIFPFSATCNLGVTRDAADSVGGFDESFVTGQDLDFCLRLWDAGHEMAHCGDAVVQYRYRPSLRALWRRSRQYGTVGPAIAARLRALGHERPAAFAGLRQWVWLVRRIPTLRTRAGRARWVVVGATKIGRIEGSVRARCVML